MGDTKRRTRRQFLVGGSVAAGLLTLGTMGVTSWLDHERQPDFSYPDVISYSADLQSVALSYYQLRSFNLVGEDSQTRIFTFNPEEKLIQTIHLPIGCFFLSAYWSPDNTRIAITMNSSQQAIGIWDVKSGSQTAYLSTEENLLIRAAAWSPDGHRLLAGGNQHFVLLDPRDGTHLFETDVQTDLSAGARGITDFTWSPDGRAFALLIQSTVTGWTTEIWDSNTYQRMKRIVTQIPLSQSIVESPHLAWSPRGDYLALSLHTALWIFDLAHSVPQGVSPVVVDPAKESATGNLIAWSPDGTRLARVYLNQPNPLSIWDVDAHHRLSAKFVGAPNTDGGSFDALAWSADGKQITAVDYRGGNNIWTVS